jgi:anion-transporting  ArsA/GET3 family ATPase
VNLGPVLAGRRVVVVCGAGGVGKTTVSAALALGLAAEGRRVAVVTIDPARRLATALGMAGLSDEPRRVDPAAARDAGLDMRGELWALQLDPKATFDRLVTRYAPSPEARDRILANRIYRHFSGTVAGAQEYMAVERLHELVDEERFECVVLDTPPAQNALDFLDAPERMGRFIEGKGLRLLLAPQTKAGRLGWKALHAGSSMVLSLLERLTGGQLLRDVSEFLQSFDGMYAGFRDRAAAVRTLLLSEEARFLVVTGPEPEPVAEAVMLWDHLAHDRYPVAAVVVNRVHPLPPEGDPDPAALAAALTAAGAGDGAHLAGAALESLQDARTVGRRDHDDVAEIRRTLDDPPLATVPALPDDPVELAGLARVTRELVTA